MFLTHSGIWEREDKKGNQENGRRKQSLSTCNCLVTHKCTSPKRENMWQIQEHSHLQEISLKKIYDEGYISRLFF